MSGGPACRCAERREPINFETTTTRPARLWRVVDRLCNYSKFNGSRWTSSAYSSITCLRCGRFWRTKASYVRELRDIAADERNISSGTAGHAKAMKARARSPHGQHPEDGR